MAFSPDIIKAEIEKKLSSLEVVLDKKTLSQIRIILYANLDRKRIDRFVGDDLSRVDKYIDEVVAYYEALSPLLSQLQIEEDPKAWEPLYESLQQWAYNFFLGKGFYPGTETAATALSCATDAAVEILAAHFPYDTDFHPWAHVILQNACRRFIRRSLKKSNIPAEKMSGLDDVEHMLSSISIKETDLKIQLDEVREGVLAALETLSPARKKVIELHYFQDFTLTEIAEELGKTVNAIYGLHFNALKDLRKILEEKRHRLDE